MNIIHILDNELIYSLSNKIYKLSPNLLYGKINNEKEFITTLQKFQKEHHINQKLLGEAITIIVNDTYTNEELKYLTDIFKDLEYSQIIIHQESSLLAKDNIEIIVDSQTTRIFNQEVLIISTSLFKSLREEIIDSLVNNSPIIPKVKIADIYNTLNSQSIDLCVYYTNPYEILINSPSSNL